MEINSRQNLVKTFNSIRDIPYEIFLNSGEDHSCGGKHIMLKKLFKEYQTRFRVCTFKWDSLNLAKHVAEIEHDNDCTHMYLEMFLDKKWIIVDATWDTGLSAIFHVNNWDGKSDTEIAVKPTKIYSPEESERRLRQSNYELEKEELERNGDFYRAFNKWLVEIRANNNKK